MANYLQLGSHGSDVSKLQQTLTNAGYNTGGIDGIFGNNTRNALINYQKANGLSADGIAGNQTFGKLYGSSQPTTSNLQNVVQNSQPNQLGYTPVKDNSSQISDTYAQQLASARAALKDSIQQSMGGYQKQIADAPNTYNPLKNQASVQGQQNLQNLRELLANGGQQGGVNRTEETQVNADTGNKINSIQLQQQQVIDTANRAINDLQAQGDIKDAQLVADNTAQKLKALIDENNRVTSENNALQQQAVQNSLAERQLQAAISSRASSGGSSGKSNSSSNNTKAEQTAMTNQAWSNFMHEFNDGTAGTWLQNNQDDIINYLGNSEYQKMFDYVKKNAEQQMYARRTSNYRIAGDGGRMLME